MGGIETQVILVEVECSCSCTMLAHLPQRIPPLTCFSFFPLGEKPSLPQTEKTDHMEGYVFCIGTERMLCDFLCFKYLLGEDGENVDQFQVLAHPKVHGETEK